MKEKTYVVNMGLQIYKQDTKLLSSNNQITNLEMGNNVISCINETANS